MKKKFTLCGTHFSNELFFLKIGILGFSESLITNLNLDLENSKWRIQDSGQKL